MSLRAHFRAAPRFAKLVPAAFGFFSLLIIATAQAEHKNYEFREIAGDQEFVGLAEVKEKEEEWLEEARHKAASNGTKVEDEAVSILNKELDNDIKAYVSPDGKARATDGHHRMRTARALMRKLGIPESRVHVRLDVEKSFSGESWEKYVRWREEHDPIYIPKSIRGRNPSFSEIVAYYRNLPSSVEELKDHPMRSALGKLFNEIELQGSSFVPAIQFRLGDELGEIGLIVKPGEENSARVQRALMDAIFSGEHSERLQKFLIEQALPQQRDAVRAQLKAAQELARGAGRLLSPPAGALRPVSEPGPEPQSGVFASLSTASPASGDSCERIYSQVDQVIERKFSFGLPPGLKGKVRIPTRKENELRLKVARRLWDDVRPDEKFVEMVGKVAKDGEVGEPFLARATAARARLKLLRFVCQAICEEEKDIQHLNRFVAELGQLEDARKFASKEQVREQAEKLLKAVTDKSRKAMEREVGAMQAVGREKLEDRVKKMTAFMREAADAPNLKGEKFHKIRKELGRLQTIVLLNGAAEDSLSEKASYEAMRRLYDRLGETHDELVKSRLTKGSAKKVTLPPELRQDILDTLKYFE